jgi:type IV secretion system protein VirD4
MFWKKEISGAYGTSVFQKKTSHFFKKKNNSLTVNGTHFLDEKLSYDHSILIAPSGAGKTSIIVLPSILNLIKHGKSFVCTDPSGELYALSKSMLQAKGYIVKILDPNHVTAQYNPLQKITCDMDIDKLADIIVQTASGQDNGNQFWNNNARLGISYAIKIALHLDNKEQNIAGVKNIIELMGGTPEQRRIPNEIALNHFSDQQFTAFTSFISQPDTTFLNIVSTMRSVLIKLSYSNISKLLEKDSISFEDLRKKDKQCIFLSIKESELDIFKQFTAIFYTQLFDFASTMPQNKNDKYNSIAFILDEFASSNIPAPIIASGISSLRKRKIAILIVLQNYSQLCALYNPDIANTIFSNCATKIFLSGMDDNSCKILSSLLGRTTFRKKKSILPWVDVESEKEMSRQLLEPSEIRRISKNETIVIQGNNQPFLLKTLPYYKNRRLKKNTFNS